MRRHRESLEPFGGPRPASVAVGRSPSLLALQRTAGNAAVASMFGPPAARPDIEPPHEVPADIPDCGAPGDIVREANQRKTLLDEAAEHAAAQVDESVLVHRARIAATVDTQESTAATALNALRTSVNSQASAQTAAMLSASTGTRTAIGAKASAATAATHTQVDTLGEEARATSEHEAARAVRESPPPESARPATGSAESEVAAGKERIAQAVAGKARTELTRSGEQTASQVRADAAATRSSLYEPAKAGAAEQIRTSAGEADRSVAEGTAATTSALRATTARTTESAVQGHQRFVASLRAGRRTAEADLDAWAAESRNRLRETAANLGLSFVAQARALAALVASRRGPAAGVGEQALTAVRTAGDELEQGIGDAAGGLEEGAGRLATDHGQAVGGVGEQSAAALGRAGEAAGAALRQSTAAFAEQAGQTQDAVGGELDRLPAKAADALSAKHREGVAGLTGTVNQVGEAQRTWVSDARSRGEGGATRFEGEAERLAAQARDQQPVQRWFAELIGSMRSWLREKCGDVLGGILSGLILSIPTIIVGVALLMSGPVGWGVLAGLLVVGAGLGIYGRWQEYKADHGGNGPSFLEGLGLVGLGIADLTGIPYIVEASVGRRAFAPTDMTPFERWERGTQGVVNLAFVVAGGVKKLFFDRVPVKEPVRLPTELPVEPAPRPRVDPHTVAIAGTDNNARFEAARQIILDLPPAERAEATQILFRRLTQMSGNSWNYRTTPTVGGGVHFTGEGAPFIFAIDGAGNVFQGKIGPGTLSIARDGSVTVDYSKLRPFNPAPPPELPAPAPAPAPVPTGSPLPRVPPRLPAPPHDREPEPVP